MAKNLIMEINLHMLILDFKLKLTFEINVQTVNV